MTPPDIFIPECIKPNHWPSRHREAWRQLFVEADLFGDHKPTLKWKPATVEKVRKGYGIWLSFNVQCGVNIDNTEPADLVTKETVRAYQETFKKQEAADYTIFSHVNELYLAIINLAPGNDWSWLKLASNNLRKRSRSKKIKLSRLKTSDQLIDCGLSLMNEAETNEGLTPYKRALMFRDGLMIALLAYRPMRAKNFVNMKLQENLILIGNCWHIKFNPSETKNKKHFEAEFPISLNDQLDKYLSIHRPFLLSLAEGSGHKIQKEALKYLWISNEGRNLDVGSFTVKIKKKTQEFFGEYIYPHLFRDASVTTLIRHEPSSARLTMSVLGHNSLEITNQHYNQSKTIEASKKFLKYLEKLSTEAV
jgi:integrase/recombinase XerD